MLDIGTIAAAAKLMTKLVKALADRKLEQHERQDIKEAINDLLKTL